MLLGYELLVVYHPRPVVSHYEEQRIEFGTCPAALALTVIDIWYQLLPPSFGNQRFYNFIIPRRQRWNGKYAQLIPYLLHNVSCLYVWLNSVPFEKSDLFAGLCPAPQVPFCSPKCCTSRLNSVALFIRINEKRPGYKGQSPFSGTGQTPATLWIIARSLAASGRLRRACPYS